MSVSNSYLLLPRLLFLSLPLVLYWRPICHRLLIALNTRTAHEIWSPCDIHSARISSSIFQVFQKHEDDASGTCQGECHHVASFSLCVNSLAHMNAANCRSEIVSWHAQTSVSAPSLPTCRGNRHAHINAPADPDAILSQTRTSSSNATGLRSLAAHIYQGMPSLTCHEETAVVESPVVKGGTDRNSH